MTKFDVDTGSVAAPEVYRHPNIRDLSQSELLDRLDNIRNRRLLAALDYREAHAAKMTKLGTKLAEQWEDLDEKNRLKIIKINELIGALEKAVEKQQLLHHKLTLAEEGLDL